MTKRIEVYTEVTIIEKNGSVENHKVVEKIICSNEVTGTEQQMKTQTMVVLRQTVNEMITNLSKRVLEI